MSKETNLSISAQCDRAARNGINEDNCLLISEVGVANPVLNHSGDVTTKELSRMISLRGKGCLLVVADGMGGMNAGEIASSIAVTTIAKCFNEEGLKNLEMTENAIKKFIRKAIVAADAAIKKEASKDAEKEGMGTTVALLWLLDTNKAYYAWCGDSRIYRYIPDVGLGTLSRDHSYVMEVLHLDEDEAFNHPDNNIITRSLGNPLEKANPDVEGPIDIYQDDFFLLCSDGLCGVLRTDDIQEVLEGSMSEGECPAENIDKLWTAAAAAGWHDNVTTIVCKVASGQKRPEKKQKQALMRTNKNVEESVNESSPVKYKLIAFFVVILALAGLFFLLKFLLPRFSDAKENAMQQTLDTVYDCNDVIEDEQTDSLFSVSNQYTPTPVGVKPLRSNNVPSLEGRTASKDDNIQNASSPIESVENHEETNVAVKDEGEISASSVTTDGSTSGHRTIVKAASDRKNNQNNTKP